MKDKFSKTTIGRLRSVGMLEGISFLLLLGIAVPLKHIWGIPVFVRIIGSLHGFLFIAYLYCLLQVTLKMNWQAPRVMKAFIAALLPFGTFIADKQLKQEELLEIEQLKLN
jgi:integral membrane protein